MKLKASRSCIFRREFWLQLPLPLIGGGGAQFAAAGAPLAGGTAQIRACRSPSVARGARGEQ